MYCAIPKTACQMQSWKRPVDCTTSEARTVSEAAKPNENLIPEKVYSRVMPAYVAAPRAVPLRLSLVILTGADCQASDPTEPVGKELSGARASIPCRNRAL